MIYSVQETVMCVANELADAGVANWLAAILPSHLWLFLLDKCLNFWLQCGQEYGFSPVWILVWVVNWCCWANCLPIVFKRRKKISWNWIIVLLIEGSVIRNMGIPSFGGSIGFSTYILPIINIYNDFSNWACQRRCKVFLYIIIFKFTTICALERLFTSVSSFMICSLLICHEFFSTEWARIPSVI